MEAITVLFATPTAVILKIATMTTISCKVLVIGAGFAGLPLAQHLAAKGIDVVLVNKYVVAHGAGQTCLGPTGTTLISMEHITRVMHALLNIRRGDFMDIAFANARTMVEPSLSLKSVLPVKVGSLSLNLHSWTGKIAEEYACISISVASEAYQLV